MYLVTKKSFIEQVTEEVKKQHKDFRNVVCIFPNHRATVHFQRELTKGKKAFFLPEITDIEKWVSRIAGVKILSNFEQLFFAYVAYNQQQSQKNKADFISFLRWVEIALADFNEIDSHLINPQEIFPNIYDTERIKKWSPSEGVKSNDYLDFIKDLEKYYNFLQKKMNEKKEGYKGWAYKKASENIDVFIKENDHKHFIFSGFNAANKATEKIFKTLLKAGKTTIFWNDDSYFEGKSAGYFMTQHKKWNYYQKDETAFTFVNDFYSGNDKNITVYNATKDNLLTQKASDLLSEIYNENSTQKTAVVLADETLLEPTLQAIAPDIKYNTSIGYPLEKLAVSSFLLGVIELQRQLEKNKEVHYEKVIALLKNHTAKKLYNTNDIVKKILKNNWVYITGAHIKNDFKTVITPMKKPLDFLEFWKEKLEKIKIIGIEKIKNCVEKLLTLENDFSVIKDFRILQILFKKIIAGEKITIKGEQTEKVQIMGLLETQSLDFENVILLGVNEGILPKQRQIDSLIPYDIKKAFHLYTYKEREAIFAYHFYRLLQRANNIHLLYNSNLDDFGKGEKSRFIMQLENDGFINRETQINAPFKNTPQKPLKIEKTADVLKTIKKIATEKGFSPSALGMYVCDPIEFYQRYVLGIKEIDTVEESIPANLMGTLIHTVLEMLYEPFIEKNITVASHQKMLEQLDETVEKIISTENFKKHHFIRGENLLIKEVCKTLVKNFIKKEQEAIKKGATIKIIALEENITVDFPIKTDEIKLCGKIDRVDKKNGLMRIIDYKTGALENKDLQTKNILEIADDPEKIKALQALTYGYIYHKYQKKIPNEAVMIGLKKSINSKCDINEATLKDTEKLLQKIIGEILEPTVPFVEKTDKK